MTFDIKNSDFVIQETATLKKALEIITANQRGTVVVIDANERLVGVLSDGDIRRAFLREASMITPVKKVMNVNYVFYQEGMKDSPEKLFEKNKHITVLPVVDNNHKLIDIILTP